MKRQNLAILENRRAEVNSDRKKYNWSDSKYSLEIEKVTKLEKLVKSKVAALYENMIDART